MVIKEINDQTRKELVEFRGSKIISRGKVHTLGKLPGYVVIINGEIKGALTYNICNHECEVVSLDSKIEDQGIGSKLIFL